MQSAKYLFLLLPFFLLSSRCDDDDGDMILDPIDQLPEATITGENTFGCLIDGEAYTPYYPFLGGGSSLIARYDISPGGWAFTLRAQRQRGDEPYRTIVIFADSIEIEDGQTFTFVDSWLFRDGVSPKGNFEGIYGYRDESGVPPNQQNIYYGTFVSSGQITFTKFSDGIASGTFWFDAITEDGSDTVRIREGRFDYDM
jgi:hypothetical protein